MPRILAALLFSLVLAVNPLVAQEIAGDASSVARDIALAGALRTQSQRLSKLYRQAALGVDAGRAKRELQAGSDQVDAALQRLARYGQRADTRRPLARSDSLWQELRVALLRPYDAQAGERVGQLADELMIASGKLALQIEAQANVPVGRLLDQTTRLNMLGQRMARLYLQIQAGDRAQGLRLDIEQARREFAGGLAELEAARDNSPASRQAIALARNQWVFFDLAIAQLDQPAERKAQALRDVASSSERIAQMLDEASGQYVRDYSAAAGRS